MATWEKVCELVEALPGTELDTGRDNPAWRVNGKVLIRRNPRMRVPDEQAIRLRRGELIAIRAERGVARLRCCAWRFRSSRRAARPHRSLP